jgi:hypothetical protein
MTGAQAQPKGSPAGTLVVSPLLNGGSLPWPQFANQKGENNEL